MKNNLSGKFRITALLFTLLSFASFAEEQPRPSTTTKNIAEAPTPFLCLLITAAGPTKINAEQALYNVGPENGSKDKVPLVSLFDSGSQQSWIGFQSAIYVLTSHGIVGFSIRTTALYVHSSLLDSSNYTMEKLRDLWTAFNKDVAPNALYTDGDHRILLSDHLPGDFGAKEPNNSQTGYSRIDSARLESGQIKINIANQSGEYKAEVLIDEGTLQLKGITRLK